MTEQKKNTLIKTRWTMEIKDVLEERSHTHGDFVEGSETFQKLMDAINDKRGNLDRVQYYALTMTAAKLVRILNGNAYEADHWRDAIGYLTLGGRLNIADEPLTDKIPIVTIK